MEVVLTLVTVLAILTGPVVGGVIAVHVARQTERNRRRMDIFRALVSTRTRPTEAIHIEAVNHILLDFGKDDEVRKAAKTYISAQRKDPMAVSVTDGCSSELLALLEEMRRALRIRGSVSDFLEDCYDGPLETGRQEYPFSSSSISSVFPQRGSVYSGEDVRANLYGDGRGEQRMANQRQEATGPGSVDGVDDDP